MKVYKFTASWCAPCQTLNKVFNELEKDGTLNQTVVSFDIDEEEDLVQHYKIRSIPTLIKVDDSGKEISRVVAPKNKTEIVGFLE